MTELDPGRRGHRLAAVAAGRGRAAGRAITATRRAVFPLHGLDPDDPRD